jgi:hypothetical protein
MANGLVQRRVPIKEWQFADHKDANNQGVYAVGAMDAMGRDIVGTENGWVEMNVTQESSQAVRVAYGRIWRDGKFYGDPIETSVVQNLATVLPTSSKRIVTIFGTGSETNGASEQRSFKNQVTGAKEPQPTVVEILRKIQIGYVAGAEAGTPQQPSLEPNYVAIAYVTLGTGGVESIIMANERRLVGLQEATARLISLEAFRISIGAQVDTLASDLALVNQKVAKTNTALYNQAVMRLAALEDRLGIDEGALLFGYDRFMTDDDSDTDHVGYKARISEGLRFPFAATSTVTPALLNPAEPRVVSKSGWMLPQHSKTRRLDIWGQWISVNVSNYQYANTSFTIFPGARRRRRYGPSQVYSANSDFWQSVAYSVNYLTGTFMKDGETFNVTDQWVEDGVTFYRVEQYWDDKIPYWNGYKSVSETVANGYCLAQTFLNAQAGWLLEVGLRFGKVDPDHSFKVFVCKAPGGNPDPSQIIATGEIAAGAAIASVAGDVNGVENVVSLTPVFLNPGERYGLIFVTGGDFAVACRSDNALSNGTLFFSDGTAFVADIGKDVNMRLYFAEFTAPYAAVQLNTVTLSGGITDIDFLSEEHVPDGTELYVEIEVGGVWKRFGRTTGTHPLAAAPNTLPMRLVFVGTKDIMPAIKLSASELKLYRADDDFNHFSEILDAGTNVEDVEIWLTLRNWNPSKHTLAATVLSGANTDTPDATTDYPQPDGSIKRVMSFTLTAPSETYQIRLVGTTTDIAEQFVVTDRYHQAAA